MKLKMKSIFLQYGRINPEARPVTLPLDCERPFTLSAKGRRAVKSWREEIVDEEVQKDEEVIPTVELDEVCKNAVFTRKFFDKHGQSYHIYECPQCQQEWVVKGGYRELS